MLFRVLVSEFQCLKIPTALSPEVLVLDSDRHSPDTTQHFPKDSAARREIARAKRAYLVVIAFILFMFTGCARSSQPTSLPRTISPRFSGEGVYEAVGKSERRVIAPRIIEVNGVPVEVDLARTPQEQAQGLSGRSTLPDGRGMLFPYDQPLIPAFWMKGMLFSIDIIWILDNKVVDVSPRLPYPDPLTPSSFLPTYSPRAPVTDVLEVPAGWAERNGVTVGSEVLILGI